MAHTLQKFCVYDEAKEWSGKFCDFLHQRYATPAVAMRLKSIIQSFVAFPSEYSGFGLLAPKHPIGA